MPPDELPLPLTLSERAAPPPSAALLEAVGPGSGVRTRDPRLALALVTVAAAGWPLYALLAKPWRSDLDALPWAWLLPVALLWLGGFVAPLTLALLPPRGQVLPDSGAAGRAALVVAAGLTLLGLFAVEAPGRTLMPADTWADFSRWWWHCISSGLLVIIPALVAGLAALARVMVVGAARLGGAVGAAGGALAGLTLHWFCPLGGVLHVALAHGGGVVLGAALGAALFPAVHRLVR
jgi:hypothetical protein